MVGEVPADVTQAQLVAECANWLIALQGRRVAELWYGLVNCHEPLKCPLFNMLRVKLCNLEFLL